MFRVSGVGRTARVSEVKEEKRQINGKAVNYKSINLTIATDRNYRDGKGNRIPDFIFCSVGGPEGSYPARIVDVINTYANKKDHEGKLISRLVEISGRLFVYSKDVPIKGESIQKIGLTKALTGKYKIPAEEAFISAKITNVVTKKITQYYVAIEEFNLLDADKTRTTSAEAHVDEGMTCQAIEPDTVDSAKNTSNTEKAVDTKVDTNNEHVENIANDDISLFNGEAIQPLDDGQIPF